MTNPQPEVTMTTSSIHHRPAPFIAAAAAVLAVGAGSLAMSVSHHDSRPSAPDHQAQTVRQDGPPVHRVATTSGGRVTLGE
jgi:hypothetical protein